MTHSAQHLSQGASVEADGVRFRLWAPGCETMSLVLDADDRVLPMQKQQVGSMKFLFPAPVRARSIATSFPMG